MMAQEKSRASASVRSARTLKAVFWSFFGMRKTSALRAGCGNAEPGARDHRGLIGAAIFVVSARRAGETVVTS